MRWRQERESWVQLLMPASCRHSSQKRTLFSTESGAIESWRRGKRKQRQEEKRISDTGQLEKNDLTS
ncbi:hypothetical protein TNCV_233981 [Trichonephila clavipes]|nr:hypothetical protein TNCV_233981 [Trichonephila clavipes]